MFSQTLLPYISSWLCSVAKFTSTSYVRAHVVSLIAGYFFTMAQQLPSGPRPAYYRRLMIILRHTTVRKTPLDEWSARLRGLYLTTHNTHNRQTFMPPAGFEPKIPASEGPQTHALDRAATGTGNCWLYGLKKVWRCIGSNWGNIYNKFRELGIKW